MNVESFWKLIDKTRTDSGGDIKKQGKLLFEELLSFSVDEILAHISALNDLMDNAYDAALWDAASIINCGSSDDGFEDFRGWLIAQGKEVYEKALIDPESLVDHIEVNEMAEAGFIYSLFILAYEHKAGPKIPTRYRSLPKLKGTIWEEEKRNSRFPKLSAKFGDCDQRESIWDAEDIEPFDIV